MPPFYRHRRAVSMARVYMMTRIRPFFALSPLSASQASLPTRFQAIYNAKKRL